MSEKHRPAGSKKSIVTKKMPRHLNMYAQEVPMGQPRGAKEGQKAHVTLQPIRQNRTPAKTGNLKGV